MMHQAIESFLENKVSPQSILILGIDDPIYMHIGSLELTEGALKACGTENAKGAWVFFDEIQYLKCWEGPLVMVGSQEGEGDLAVLDGG